MVSVSFDRYLLRKGVTTSSCRQDPKNRSNIFRCTRVVWIQILVLALYIHNANAFAITNFNERNVQIHQSSISSDSIASQSTKGVHNSIHHQKQKWVDRGIFVSSFTDGLKNNQQAHDFLQHSLIRALISEELRNAEASLTESALYSPCCGPGMDHLKALHDVDERWAAVNAYISYDSVSNLTDSLLSLLPPSTPRHVRFVYIPTAMYALRPDSTNTPGKQRQRARADGKQRRNEIVSLLQSILNGYNVEVLVVTLDLDDGSIKQPEGSKNATLFPKHGKEALETWHPHIIYVDGGNTFWLYHCMEKGGWSDLLVQACCTQGGTVYVGSSAGAIHAGSTMETACWKGWDDPRVVPGHETYAHWRGVSGLSWVGNMAFFPHMNETLWRDLVATKKDEWNGTAHHEVCCLHDSQVCCVNGATQETFLLSADTAIVETVAHTDLLVAETQARR
jgi:hypothetical protein